MKWQWAQKGIKKWAKPPPDKRPVAIGLVTAYSVPVGEHRMTPDGKTAPLPAIDFEKRWRLLAK